jgi:outer membrane protein TolC
MPASSNCTSSIRTWCCEPLANWRRRHGLSHAVARGRHPARRERQRHRDIATLQYREGLVDFQRVLDTQRALNNQQERLVTSEGNVA